MPDDGPAIQVIVAPAPIHAITISIPPPQTVSVGSPLTVNTVSSSTETVMIEELGLAGPQGPTGATGPAGQDGAVPSVYQLVDVSSWSQAHAYGYLPEVRILDADGVQVWLAVSYPDTHTVYLQFPHPFTGEVLLS